MEKYLEGIVSQDIYEETDVGYEEKVIRHKSEYRKCWNNKWKMRYLWKRQWRILKKTLSQNEVLQEFDRGIFESIIEKVIVGGYDEDGNKRSYKITFYI